MREIRVSVDPNYYRVIATQSRDRVTDTTIWKTLTETVDKEATKVTMQASGSCLRTCTPNSDTVGILNFRTFEEENGTAVQDQTGGECSGDMFRNFLYGMQVQHLTGTSKAYTCVSNRDEADEEFDQVYADFALRLQGTNAE